MQSVTANGDPLTQEKLAEQLFVSVDTVSNWERDLTRIQNKDRKLLLNLLQIFIDGGGIGLRERADDFLKLGEFRALDDAEVSLLAPAWLPTDDPSITDHNAAEDKDMTTITQINGDYVEGDKVSNEISGDYVAGSKQNTQIAGDYVAGNKQTTIHHTTYHGPVVYQTGLWGSLKWTVDRLGLVSNDSHTDHTFAGRFIFAFSKVFDYIQAHALYVVSIIAAWLFAAFFMDDLFLWQATSDDRLLRICLDFALAGVAVPMVIGLITIADDQQTFDISSKDAVHTMKTLKVTGALSGFAGMLGALYLVSIALSMLGINVPATAWRLAIGIPMFFSVIGAKRIPVDRQKMFAEMRLHDADRLFFFVCIFFSSGLAALTYFGYEQLTDVLFWALALLAVSVLAIWRSYKRAHN